MDLGKFAQQVKSACDWVGKGRGNNEGALVLDIPPFHCVGFIPFRTFLSFQSIPFVSFIPFRALFSEVGQ